MIATANAIAGIATSIRGTRSDEPRSRRRTEVISTPSETADARLVGGERLLEVRPREVRPQHVGEMQLGVGGLPQQVVRDPLLARGPDQQIGVVHLRRVQQLPERLLPAAGV